MTLLIYIHKNKKTRRTNYVNYLDGLDEAYTFLEDKNYTK